MLAGVGFPGILAAQRNGSGGRVRGSREEVVLRVLAIVAAALSAFFVFYTGRLLAVTGFLQRTRPGGGGAYVGAVVFPLLAIAFAWAAYRAWQGARRVTDRPV